MKEREHIYCLDFDGTLTTQDTLLAFIAYVHGGAKLFRTLLRYSPWLVGMKLGLYPNWAAKQRIFSHLFRDMPLDIFDRHCRDFAAGNSHLVRPMARHFLHTLLAERKKVIIISASIENWVNPFFEEIDTENAITVLGTRVEVKNGKLTGRFLTANCYGQEKVRRLEAILPLPRERYFISAYGDSRGDKELLDYADKGHFKPFRR